MSGLIGLTPVVRLRVENLLLGKRYPQSGWAEAVIDTGYQGFVAVPRGAFASLSIPRPWTSERSVRLADGSVLRSEMGPGTATVDSEAEVDGPIETLPGLAEVLVGTQFLSRFRLELDYCLRSAVLARCG